METLNLKIALRLFIKGEGSFQYKANGRKKVLEMAKSEMPLPTEALRKC